MLGTPSLAPSVEAMAACASGPDDDSSCVTMDQVAGLHCRVHFLEVAAAASSTAPLGTEHSSRPSCCRARPRCPPARAPARWACLAAVSAASGYGGPLRLCWGILAARSLAVPAEGVAAVREALRLGAFGTLCQVRDSSSLRPVHSVSVCPSHQSSRTRPWRAAACSSTAQCRLLPAACVCLHHFTICRTHTNANVGDAWEEELTGGW